MKLYIVVWSHQYGKDAWPVFADVKPSIDEIEQSLLDSGDWTERRPDTHLDVFGPSDLPTQEPDAVIENYAPDIDAVLISIGSWKISIERDEISDVFVTVKEEESGTEERCVLGKEGTTTKA